MQNLGRVVAFLNHDKYSPDSYSGTVGASAGISSWSLVGFFVSVPGCLICCFPGGGLSTKK
jgi:hypothetical protein